MLRTARAADVVGGSARPAPQHEPRERALIEQTPKTIYMKRKAAVASQEPIGIVISRGADREKPPVVFAYVWAPAPEAPDEPRRPRSPSRFVATPHPVEKEAGAQCAGFFVCERVASRRPDPLASVTHGCARFQRARHAPLACPAH